MAKLTLKQKTNREIWMNALRSGKYKRGKYRLKTYAGKFCCLGVAREVIPSIAKRDASSVSDLTNLSNNELGLHYGDDAINEGDCMAMNDGHNMSFVQIADVLLLDTLMRGNEM